MHTYKNIHTHTVHTNILYVSGYIGHCNPGPQADHVEREVIKSEN